MVNIEIPQIQNGVNPLLPVQHARLQDDVDRHLSDDHLGNGSTDQTDSVELEQSEDLPMFNSTFSMSLELPQVMGESPIHSFSTSSEVGI